MSVIDNVTSAQYEHFKQIIKQNRKNKFKISYHNIALKCATISGDKLKGQEDITNIF